MDYTESIPSNKESSADKDFDPSSQNLRIIDTELDSAQPVLFKKEKTIRKNQLVNKLNYLNFNSRTIKVNFRHNKDKRVFSLDVLPQICFGSHLVCLWQEAPDVSILKRSYHFEEAIINENKGSIYVNAGLRAMSRKGLCLTLPKKSVQASSRRTTRYACSTLKVTIIQNGIVFSGILLDFSAVSFKAEIHPHPNAELKWLNFKDKINLLVFKQEEAIFSSECEILKKEQHSGRWQLILRPLATNIQRFSPKEYRSRRISLSPSPDIKFLHPFTEKLVTLKAVDVSGSGLSVEDDEENSVLVPGMIIPDMTINLANAFKFSCQAQVVYRRSGQEENESSIHCGIAFLDMDCNDHMRLLSLLHQAENQHLYICNDVDMEQLWEFFFDAGFIYPQKYKYIQENREKIRRTYENLYTRNSNVSRYFTWQKKGFVQGHLSMLRFYEKTWLIHHLAALAASQARIGVKILKQIGSFTYDSHRLYSSNMDYLICYFRPENRFSNYFFGGIFKNIKNPEACSINEFAYLHYRPQIPSVQELPENWRFEKSTYSDLKELYSCYDSLGLGLMLKALDLLPDEEMRERHSLADEYRKINMKRLRKLFSLRQNSILKAVFMINISDFAINLSDLTSSVSIFVADSEDLSASILYHPLHLLAEEYEQKTFPVLVFPLQYADQHCLLHERVYNLWVLNMEHTDDYFKNFNCLA